MADPFISEIRIFGFNFNPRGWAYCDGGTLPISQNTALFSLVGTMYGGDGRSTLGLPNLQGRAAMHTGNGPGLTPRSRMGEVGGSNTATINISQLGNHTHIKRGEDEDANATTVSGNAWSKSEEEVYAEDGSMMNMSTACTAPVGNGTAPSHNNLQPYLTLNFCIALTGTFPSRS